MLFNEAGTWALAEASTGYSKQRSFCSQRIIALLILVLSVATVTVVLPICSLSQKLSRSSSALSVSKTLGTSVSVKDYEQIIED